MTYLPYIDGLRAVAILAVVAYHALPWALPGGFAGVDVFFVISGFLITRFISAELADGRFSFGHFLLRRARRLLPAAVVCFTVVAGLAAFVLLPDAYLNFGQSLLSSILLYANIYFDNNGGYFSAPSLEKPLLHAWSLAVEDQFYLTWPLLLMVLQPRVSRSVLVAIACAIAVASLAYAEVVMVRDPEFAFFQLPTRAWELLVGVIVALTAQRIVLPRAAADITVAVGLSAIAASFWQLNASSHFPGLGAAPAVLGTAAVIVAGLNQKTFLTGVLSWRPIVFVGLISYSLYLWHWPLISLSSYWLERPLATSEALVVVAVSFVLAVLSWRYVERPFRASHQTSTDRSLSAADWRFLKLSAVSVGVVIATALSLKVFKGFPERYDAQVQTVLEQMVAGNPLRRYCDDYQKIFSNDDVCNLGRKRATGESYDVALFGDSMADHWAPLVAKFAIEKQLAFRQVTNGGCALLFGVDIPAETSAKELECKSYQHEAEKFIAANPGLKLAVISGYWEKWLGLLNAKPAGSSVAAANAAHAAPSLFDETLDTTIKAFTQRGIKVLLIGQIPIYDSLPVRCIVAEVRRGANVDKCSMARSIADQQVKLSDAALRQAAARPNVSQSLPSTFMCGANLCSPIMDGVFLYKNNGHVNRYGAEYLRQYVEFPSVP